MNWATRGWKVLSLCPDPLSLSLIHPLGFSQSCGSRSVTSAFPASAPAPPSGWPGPLAGGHCRLRGGLARLGWAGALCFLPSSNLHKELRVMLRLTPELEFLYQCQPAEPVSSELWRPQWKPRDNESAKGRGLWRARTSIWGVEHSICNSGSPVSAGESTGA